MLGALAIPLSIYLLRRFSFSTFWAVALSVLGSGTYAVGRTGGLDFGQALATAIFVYAFAIIASERIHRTKVAMAAAAAMLLLGIIDQHAALHGHDDVPGTDWNTLLLLIGMMVVVHELRRTGVFGWTAIRAAKLARGNPVLILIYLCVATAVISALLDNVTTVLLFVPVTILICERLKVGAAPYVIFVVLASNIGGTATLIGDPPNIMIGSFARLSFMDFVKVDGPIALASLVLLVGIIAAGLRNRLHVSPEAQEEIMEFDESRAITETVFLRRCGVVVALVLLGFFLHGTLGLEPATIALGGAAAVLLLRKGDAEETLREVEWQTIFFYLGLFIMVSGLAEVGVVDMIARALIDSTCGGDVSGGLTGAQLFTLTMGTLWLSAISAAIMGNVALVPMMNAVIYDIGLALHPSPETATFVEIAHSPCVYPLWWALSLGACFGGNFTLVGAGANLVAAGIADRSRHPVTFVSFMKYGIPFTLVTMLMASAYLWLRFLR
ncbi:MAG: ArsB/NhaD family transporter [Armatimonadetes bacterium]|nr:ArsB/NhaD family transporter [Armatimonadota bacterium]